MHPTWLSIRSLGWGPNNGIYSVWQEPPTVLVCETVCILQVNVPNIQFRCTSCVHTWIYWTFFGWFIYFFAFFLFISASSALSISSDVLLLQSSSGISKKDWRVNGLTRRDVFFFCVLRFFTTKNGYSWSPSGLQPTHLCSLWCFSIGIEIIEVCVKLFYSILLQIEVMDGTSCS